MRESFEKQIAKVKSKDPSFVSLELYSSALNDSHIDVLVDALQDNTIVRKVDVSENNISEDGAAKLIDCIAHTNVRHLNLSYNQIGDQSAKSLALLMSSSDCVLEFLDISSNTNISDESLIDLFDAIRENKSLRYFATSESTFGSEDVVIALANAIRHHKTLKTLILDSVFEAGEWFSHISDALKSNRSLTSLSIAGNGLDCTGLASLGLALKVNSTLKELDISANQIVDVEFSEFASGLASNKSLTSIDMRFNSFSAKAIEQLAIALTTNRNVTRLSLSDIDLSSGFHHLITMLETNKSLEALELESACIKAEYLKSLFVVLKSHMDLQCINISHNPIDAYSTQSFIKLVKCSTSLVDISFSSLFYTEDDCQNIYEAVKVNTNIFYCSAINVLYCENKCDGILHKLNRDKIEPILEDRRRCVVDLLSDCETNFFSLFGIRNAVAYIAREDDIISEERFTRFASLCRSFVGHTIQKYDNILNLLPRDIMLYILELAGNKGEKNVMNALGM